MTKILSIGEIMVEMSDIGEGMFRQGFAGDTFNVAYYLHTLGAGELDVDYLTAVGMDTASTACLEFMRGHGLGTGACQRDPDHTVGLYVLSNDAAGEKHYDYWRGQSAARHLFDHTRTLDGYDLVYLSGITAAVTLNRDNLISSLSALDGSGCKIAYDFNYRHKLWTTGEARTVSEDILAHADIIKISDEEQGILYPGQSIGDLSSRLPNAEWVLTCGGEKAECWQGGDLVASQVYGSDIKVVDSTAAGDSFIAAYIVSRISGGTCSDALSRGHQLASRVIQHKGAIISLGRSG